MGYWAAIYRQQNPPTLPTQTASKMAQSPLVNQKSDLKSDGLLMSRKEALWFISKNKVIILLVVLVQITCHCAGSEKSYSYHTLEIPKCTLSLQQPH